MSIGAVYLGAGRVLYAMHAADANEIDDLFVDVLADLVESRPNAHVVSFDAPAADGVVQQLAALIGAARQGFEAAGYTLTWTWREDPRDLWVTVHSAPLAPH